MSVKRIVKGVAVTLILTIIILATILGLSYYNLMLVNTKDSRIKENIYMFANMHATTSSSNVTMYRSPQIVYSMEAVLIFAKIYGDFKNVTLSVTITLNLQGPSSKTESINANLPLIPVFHAPGWYVTSIPGLPAKTIKTKLATWIISSRVVYSLLVDGVVKFSDNYTVIEGTPMHKKPLAYAAVYDVLHDPVILNETMGLGPRGWKWGANKGLNMIILAIDDDGIQNVSFEYSINSGKWNSISLTTDPLTSSIENLINDLNNSVNKINSILEQFGLPLLPSVSFSVKIYDTTIPGYSAGNYIMFRANVTDINGNQTTSPLGFYFVVNETSTTRVLIVDPHVKLWIFQTNIRQFTEELKNYYDYQVPEDVISRMIVINKIVDIIKKYSITPFHYWNLLGKYYNLYIAWPNEVNNLLKNQTEGGFEPHTIILSNLFLGPNNTNTLNWDLKDLNVLDNLVNYIKEHHAGLIATHGTISDWIVWTTDQHYKVGSRGHVGNSLDDINISNETTIAALLGLPQLALWELLRDTIAYTLYSNPETKPLGQMIGSIPLQVPYVPFNGSMHLTPEGKTLKWDIPQNFTIQMPSIYNEFGFNAYTQVGWQLAMPRTLAYITWSRTQETAPLAGKLYDKISKFMENITQGAYHSEKIIYDMNSSLTWALRNFYKSIISANISDTKLSIIININGTNKTLTIDISKAYKQLLQLMPVKLLAISNDGLAGIITYDKYWTSDGYRSVYFTFEPETINNTITTKLLTQAIQWTKQWKYENITELLKNTIRADKTIIKKFLEINNNTPGNSILSKPLLLNEEGHNLINITSDKGLLHLIILHPTSDKINTTINGNTTINKIITTNHTTEIHIKIHTKGNITISINADPNSSINPAYIEIKFETPQTTTTPTTTTTKTTTQTTITPTTPTQITTTSPTITQTTTTPATLTTTTTPIITPSPTTTTPKLTTTTTPTTTTLSTTPSPITLTGPLIFIIAIIIGIILFIIIRKHK
jgi:hypothetical protein